MVTLYNVVSQDGFIAHPDGSEGFIPDELWLETLAVIGKYSTFVTGRKTYDTLTHYDPAQVASLEALSVRKVVVSADPNFHPKTGYELARSPEEATAGENVLVSSGPNLNSYLIKHHLIDGIIVHVVPVSIGDGIPQFDAEATQLAQKIKIIRL